MGRLVDLYPSIEQEPFMVGGNVDGEAHDDCNGSAVEFFGMVMEVRSGAEDGFTAPAVESRLLVTQLDDVQPSHEQ